MKRNNIFLIITLLVILLSCNSDEKVNGNGFVRIGVVTNTSVITKAEDDVEIKNIRLIITNTTEDVSEDGWSKEYNFAPDESIDDIELSPGNYKLVAVAGNGSDVADGFTPSYVGETTVEVMAGKTSTAQIECLLTTVKVSVEYASSVVSTYNTEYKTVIGGVTFSKEETRAGYIAPGDLSVDFMFKDNTGNWQTISLDKITEAKARDFYKITISMKPTEGGGDSSEGAANITILVGEENKQDIEIGIELPKTVVTTLDAENVECETATLKGSYVSPSGTIEPSSPVFFYRKKGVEDWTNNIPAISIGEGSQYSASLTGLEEDTEYEYKFLEKGNIVLFRTKEGDKTLEEKAIGVDVAYVYGILNTNSETPYFEYKLASAADWTSATKVSAVVDVDGKYKAELTNLAAGQSYQYRFMESKVIRSLTTCSSVSVKSVTAGADYAKIKWDIQHPVGLQESDQVIVSYKYKKQGDGSWSDLQTLTITMLENGNKNIMTGLEQKGTYCVDNNANLFAILPYSDFETWSQYSGAYRFLLKTYNYKTWYAGTQDEANDKDSFWDSGNYGTSADMAAVAGYKNPTSPADGNRPGGTGKKVAYLKSQYVGLGGKLGKFAAGNLYIGKYGKTIGTSGAEINFGRKWTTRPTSLHGWYKYTAGTVDKYQGENGPQIKGQQDRCAIYIALVKAENPVSDELYHLLDNTDLNTFIDFSSANKDVIAYGEISDSQSMGSKNNDWEEFDIPLVYRDTEAIPTHILVVTSASKYGDYFTGSENSEMYLDDFELKYDYLGVPYK